MLVACRLADLSALEGRYAGRNGRTQQAHAARADLSAAELMKRGVMVGAGSEARFPFIREAFATEQMA